MSAVKRLRLTVIESDEPRWMPDADGHPPATRGECPDTSKVMCGAWRCRYFLLRIDAHDRAGRPGLANVPRNDMGHTEKVLGIVGTERPESTLDPRWLDENGNYRHIPTCALDEIDRRGKIENEQIGDLMGRHRTLIARVWQSATGKLKARGVTSDDIARLIDPQATNDRVREPSRAKQR